MTRRKQSSEAGTRNVLPGSTSNAVQARDIQGGIHLHQAQGWSLPVPQQLPYDVQGFVGRDKDLHQLDMFVTEHGGQTRAVLISAIAGTAGVGKTALAVHWAHRAREQFPDGQLYVNLRGYDPGPPMTPDQALDGMLRALDAPVAKIPRDLQQRAALYRSLLAGRKMLVVLDNAATAEQVRPLLPGTSTCTVLVTSRSRLSALGAREGARRITLDLLPEEDSVALLSGIIGPQRADAERDVVIRLARLCVGLPLALRIAAERAVAHPHVRLTQLATELADRQTRLNALTIDDDQENIAVRAVFSWSYHALPVDAGRMFRLLGLHPGPQVSLAGAAALAGTTVTAARRLLDVLVGSHLLEQPVLDRFQFHDLLRDYANDQAHHDENPDEIQAGLRRLFEWYLHTSDSAQSLIDPHHRRIHLDKPTVGVEPLKFSGYQEAINWCETEHSNLVEATRHATDSDSRDISWKIPLTLARFYLKSFHWDGWITTHQIGLNAARALSERHGEAELLNSISLAHLNLRNLQISLDYQKNSLIIRREIGDQYGEGVSLNNLGFVYHYLRVYHKAYDCFRRAVDISRSVGAPGRLAISLSNMSMVCTKLGKLDEAVQCIEEYLQISQDLGHRYEDARRGFLAHLAATMMNRGQVDQAMELLMQAVEINEERGSSAYFDLIGLAYQQMGQYENAIECHRRAVDYYNEVGFPAKEATALGNLGFASHKAGKTDVARECWSQALTLLDSSDDPIVQDLHAHLTDPDANTFIKALQLSVIL